MATTKQNDPSTAECIREAAAQLARHRRGPVLLFVEKQKADYPLNTSRLLPGTALRQLQQGVMEMYDVLVTRITKENGLRPFEAGSKAAELIGGLYAPLVGQLDPARLADCARGLAVGQAYAERVLKRYRPALYAERGEALLRTLIQAYPAHGFVLDREELTDLGLPNRSPDETEARLLDQLALALIQFKDEADVIEVVGLAGKAAHGTVKARTSSPTPAPIASPTKGRQPPRPRKGTAP